MLGGILGDILGESDSRGLQILGDGDFGRFSRRYSGIIRFWGVWVFGKTVYSGNIQEDIYFGTFNCSGAHFVGPVPKPAQPPTQIITPIHTHQIRYNWQPNLYQGIDSGSEQ